jgi:DNA (cytosine-5)-methyltransferase 1
MMRTFVDLFAGAGGMSLGLEAAGFECIGAVEEDRFAALTYQHNFPHVPILQRRTETITDSELTTEFAGVDLIVGGPPCQGFSVAGPRQYGRIDERNSLVFEVARAVVVLRPKWVVLENVRGLLTGKTTGDAAIYDRYVQILQEHGYHSDAVLLQAAHFGVPQFRERVFVLSARERPVDAVVRRLKQHRMKTLHTVRDAILDLPGLAAGEGTEEPQPYDRPAASDYLKVIRNGDSGVCNHVAMKHTRRIVDRIRHILPGKSLKDAPPQHGQRARNSHEIDAGPRYKMNYSRLSWQEPSIGVTANFQTIHVHPEQHRVITAREGARLQSFPDSFVFKGPRTTPSRKLLEREGRWDEIGLYQYKQIGNAVPPLLAKGIGEILREAE